MNYWIVMDGILPVFWSKTFNEWIVGKNAHMFGTYAEAVRVKWIVRSSYYERANAAPDIESFQFKSNMKAADGVRIVRVVLHK